MGRKGSGEHSIASLLAYPITHLKGFLAKLPECWLVLNDVIMPACNLEKDDKVVRNARPTNTANTISHHCSLISRSIQVSCIYFNNSAPRAVNSLRHSRSCAVQSPKSGDRPTAMIYCWLQTRLKFRDACVAAQLKVLNATFTELPSQIRNLCPQHQQILSYSKILSIL